jgi:hypothetical protein
LPKTNLRERLLDRNMQESPVPAAYLACASNAHVSEKAIASPSRTKFLARVTLLF